MKITGKTEARPMHNLEMKEMPIDHHKTEYQP